MSIVSSTSVAAASESTATLRRRRVVIIDQRSELVARVNDKLQPSECDVETVGTAADLEQFQAGSIDTVIFSPLCLSQGSRIADLDFSESVLRACAQQGVSRLVLLSSAEVYGAHYCNPGLLPEKLEITLRQPNAIAERWSAIESLGRELFEREDRRLLTLRPCHTLLRDGKTFLDQLFRAWIALRPAGFDPSMQLLSVEDLATAIATAVTHDAEGVYNVAPDKVIPLRKALRRAGTLQVPLPRLVYRLLTPLSRLSSRERSARFEYLRYSWAISNQKIKDELGFQPTRSSAEAIEAFRGRQKSRPTNGKHQQHDDPDHDAFGMDEAYIRACGKWQLGFVEKAYWRIDTDGFEHIPTEGAAVLVGPHRGFMPFDGVMMVHLLTQRLGRVPRFLIHPLLVKHPHLAGFMTRLGGIIACRENAERILQQQEIVGVFPEGIRGAFRMYEGGATYQLGRFRDDFAVLALAHGVPIVPFVTIGPAETFPILKKVDWPWWKRQTHWPFFPITPTWPLLPVPLPSKWHVRILEPIPTAHYGRAAAKDRRVVAELSKQVRQRMQSAIDDLLMLRTSIFFGSIFQRESESMELSLASATATGHELA